MPNGIIVFGASGAGKSTLGRALAQHLNFQFFDLDDYLLRTDTDIPYTAYYSKEERTKRLMNDISNHTHFVMSGQMWSIRESFTPLFNLAVLITAPVEILLERYHSREFSRWGNRILPGGDMYENTQKHLISIEQYDTAEPPAVCRKRDEQWITEMSCSILRVDGTKPILENVKWIAGQKLL